MCQVNVFPFVLPNHNHTHRRGQPGSSVYRTEASHNYEPLQCVPLYDDVLISSKLKCVLEFEILRIYVCTFDATALGNLGEKRKITNRHGTLGVALLLNCHCTDC